MTIKDYKIEEGDTLIIDLDDARYQPLAINLMGEDDIAKPSNRERVIWYRDLRNSSPMIKTLYKIVDKEPPR